MYKYIIITAHPRRRRDFYGSRLNYFILIGILIDLHRYITF